jgi:hypothetical protein
MIWLYMYGFLIHRICIKTLLVKVFSLRMNCDMIRLYMYGFLFNCKCNETTGIECIPLSLELS